MGEVTVRELQNHASEVIDRVVKGERVTVTRTGKPVAELRPLIASGISAEGLLERWRHLPIIDPVGFRADLDNIIDSSV